MWKWRWLHPYQPLKKIRWRPQLWIRNRLIKPTNSSNKRLYVRLLSDFKNVEISLSYYLFVSVVFFIFCVVMLYMIPTLTECWYRSHHSQSFFTNRHKEFVLYLFKGSWWFYSNKIYIFAFNNIRAVEWGVERS